jgi:hypothetical protein
MILVYYYLPQDGDDPEHPNVFCVPDREASNLTIADIRRLFPLAGTYLFRVKHSYQNRLVWLDPATASARVPTYNGRVFVKATRVAWEPTPLPEKKKEKETRVREHAGDDGLL